MGIWLIPAGLFLLFLLYRKIFHRLWNSGLAVTLSFDVRTVTEGEHARLTEIVENRERWPLPILQISFRVRNGLIFENTENMIISDTTSVSDVFCLSRQERLTRELGVRCDRRGYYQIQEVSVQGTDLFSADIHYENLPQSTALSVLPGRLPGEHYELPVSQLLGDIVVRRSLFEDTFSFRGIRDYTVTDPESAINWKATAHSGSLKVDLRERTAGQRICLLLNLEAPAALFNEDLLEDSIRLAGTLAAEAAAWDIPVRLCANGRDILTDEPISTSYGASGDHVRDMLEALSRIDLTKEPGVFAALLEELADGAEWQRDEQHGICYVVISTSVREQTVSGLCRFAERIGEKVTWLSPVAPDMPVPQIPQELAQLLQYRRLVRR